jgi:4'-phosphopantetheinyl transferase EntD
VLNLLRVISITDPANLRSLAVMRRLGMVFDHQAEIEDMGMIFQAVIYAITAEQWRSRAAAAAAFTDHGGAHERPVSGLNRRPGWPRAGPGAG